jgi:heptaprenylglyceryl phosphate synthase
MEKVLICRKCLSVKPDFLPGIYCEYCGGVLDECEAEINKIQEKKKLLKELYGGGKDEKEKSLPQLQEDS